MVDIVIAVASFVDDFQNNIVDFVDSVDYILNISQMPLLL
jgi:hypothetical protein